MWAQCTTIRVKPGAGVQVTDMIDRLTATAQPNPDVLQALDTSEQRDPTSVVIAR